MTFTVSRSISAHQKWTRLCDVTQGLTYDFIATGTWFDWYEKTDADGYESALFKPVAWLKRLPQERWFALIGIVDGDPSTAFKVGRTGRWIATRSGELGCFANDIPWMYWNNSGAVTVQCTAADR